MATERARFDDVALTGAGFVLRAPHPGDADRITTACNDPQTLRWLPLPQPYTRETALEFIGETSQRELATGEGLVRAIEVEGRIAGMIDLKRTDWRNQVSEIGYWVAPDSRGRGLASGAARLLGDWALREQDMERIEIVAATQNLASQSVAEKVGYLREGVLRSAGYTNDRRVDLVVFGRVRADLG